MTQRRKLLLADDSLAVQKVVSLTFEDEGLEVVAVGNGDQAVGQLEDDNLPDIVLADIFMPGLNGYEVCARIKNDGRFQHIPVLLLVGTFEPFNETEARRVGANGVVTKPFQSIKDLVSKVGALLGGGGSSSNSSNREDEADTRDLPAPSPDAARSAVASSDTGARTQQINSPATSPLPWNEPDITATGASEEGATEAGSAPEIPVAASAAEVSFADLGMDDRMIEERPVGHQADDDATTHVMLRPDADEDIDADDVRQDDHRDEPAGAVAAAHQDWAFAQDDTPEPTTHAAAHEGGAWSHEKDEDEEVTLVNTPSPFFASSPGAEDSLLDLDNGEPPPHALSEADDFILDLTDDASDAPSAASYHAATSSTANAASAVANREHWEQTSGATTTMQPETVSVEPESLWDEPVSAVDTEGAFAEAAHGDVSVHVFADESDAMPATITSATAEDAGDVEAQGAGSVDSGKSFDALHVLEKSGSINDTVQDLDTHGGGMVSFAEAAGLGRDVGSAAATMYQEPEAVASSSVVPSAEGAGGEQPQSSATGGGQITLEQLSPEAIDAIARRAIELLSERVVREIAWDVVPELAELLIKKRLDEERHN